MIAAYLNIPELVGLANYILPATNEDERLGELDSLLERIFY